MQEPMISDAMQETRHTSWEREALHIAFRFHPTSWSQIPFFLTLHYNNVDDFPALPRGVHTVAEQSIDGVDVQSKQWKTETVTRSVQIAWV